MRFGRGERNRHIGIWHKHGQMGSRKRRAENESAISPSLSLQSSALPSPHIFSCRTQAVILLLTCSITSLWLPNGNKWGTKRFILCLRKLCFSWNGLVHSLGLGCGKAWINFCSCTAQEMWTVTNIHKFIPSCSACIVVHAPGSPALALSWRQPITSAKGDPQPLSLGQVLYQQQTLDNVLRQGTMGL